MLNLNYDSYIELETVDSFVNGTYTKSDVRRVVWNDLDDDDKEACIRRAYNALESINYPCSRTLIPNQYSKFPRTRLGVEHRELVIFGKTLRDYEIAQMLQSIEFARQSVFENEDFVERLSIGKESRTFNNKYINYKASITTRYGLCVDAFEQIQHWLLGTY